MKRILLNLLAPVSNVVNNMIRLPYFLTNAKFSIIPVSRREKPFYMKRIILFCTLLMTIGYSNTLLGQSVGDYGSVASAAWNVASTWGVWNGSSFVGPAPSAPDNTKNVYIQGGFTVTAAASSVCNNLTINSGSTLSFPTTASVTVVASGTITSSGTISFVSASTSIGKFLQFNGASATINGTWTNNTTSSASAIDNGLHYGGAGTATLSGSATIGGPITVSSGTLQLGTNVATTMYNTSSSAGYANLSVASSATFNPNGKTLTTASGKTNMDISGILLVDGATFGGQYIGFVTTANTTLQNNSTVRYTGTSTPITGFTNGYYNVTIGNGTTVFSNSSSSNITVKGTLTVSANATWSPASASTLTLSAATSGIVNNGTLTLNSMTVSTTPTLQSQYNASYTVTGTLTNGSGVTFAPTGGTITMSGAGTGITNSGTALTFNNLIIATTPTTQYSSSYNIAGTLTVNNGVTFAPSGGTITLSSNSSSISNSGTLTFSGLATGANAAVTNTASFNIAGALSTNATASSFTATAGTITMTGTSWSVVNNGTNLLTNQSINFNNLTISGSRTLFASTYVFAVSGLLSVGAGVTLNMNNNQDTTANAGPNLILNKNGAGISGGGTIVLSKLTVLTPNPSDIVTISNTTWALPIAIGAGNQNGGLYLTKGILKMPDQFIDFPKAFAIVRSATSDFANGNDGAGAGDVNKDGGTLKCGINSGQAVSVLGGPTIYNLICYAAGNGAWAWGGTGATINGIFYLGTSGNSFAATGTAPKWGIGSTFYVNTAGQPLASSVASMWTATGAPGTVGAPYHVTLVNNGTQSVSQDRSINGILTILPGGINGGTNPAIISISGGTAGAFSCAGLINHNSFTAPSGANFTVSGPVINTGGTFNANSGKFIFSGTSQDIGATAAVTVNATTVTGSPFITLSSVTGIYVGMTTSTNTANIPNGTRVLAIVGSTAYMSANATASASLQSTQFNLTNAAPTFFNLQVNNTATVKLRTPITVANVLTLATTGSAGTIQTDATNILNVTNVATAGGSTGAITGGGTNNYIDGPVKWTLFNSGTNVYNVPLGAGGNYLPLSLSSKNTTASNIATFQAFASSPGGSVSGLDSFSVVQYWTLSTSQAAGFTTTGSTVTIQRPTTLTGLNLVGKAPSVGGQFTSAGGSAGGTSGTTGDIGITYPTGTTWVFDFVKGPSPSITLANNVNGQIGNNSIAFGATDVPVFNFQTAVTVTNATLSQVDFTTTGGGGLSNTDITNFKLWYSGSPTFASASTIGTPITSGTGAGSHSFTGLSNPTNTGTTGYYWITATIAANPTSNASFAVSGLVTTPTPNLSYTDISANQSGSTSNGGTQTIVAAPAATTNAATNLTASTVTLNGSVNGNGVATTPFFDYGQNITDNTNTSVSTSTLTVPFTGTSTVTKALTNLLSQTLYNFRVGGTNVNGTTTGSTLTFRTWSAAPLSQASGLSATTTNSTTSFTTNATLTIGTPATFPGSGATQAGYLVIYSTGTPALVGSPNGLPPTLGQAVSSGSIATTTATVLPSTPSTSVSITGLTSCATYNVKVIPYTWDGVNSSTYNYLTSGTIASVVITTSSAAYNSTQTPWTIGTQIEAENYDFGGEGCAFHWTNTGQPVGLARTPFSDGNTTTTPFIQTEGAGRSLGYGRATHYLIFTSNFPKTGLYKFQVNTRYTGGGGAPPIQLQFQVDGVNVGNELQTSNTGLTALTTTTGVSINAGIRKIKLLMIDDESNNDWIKFYTTPTLATPTVTVTGNTTATLGATISDNGADPTMANSSTVTARGTAFKTTSPVVATDNQAAQGGTATGAFTQGRTGLASQTKYFYVGYATNSVGTDISPEGSFYTFSAPPSAQPTGISATPGNGQVTLNWSTGATFPGSGATVAGYVVVYRLQSVGAPSLIASPNGLAPASVINQGTLFATPTSTLPATPSTSVTVTGLTNGATYNFLVIPYTHDGSTSPVNPTFNYLTSGTQLTISANTAVAPTVTLPTAAAITNNSATLGATITSNGGSALTERGTAYKTSSPVVATDNQLAEGGTAVGLFTQPRGTGGVGDPVLLPQQQYFYVGYATNIVGTGISGEGSFRTLSNPPTAQPTALSGAPTGPTQITLSWTAATFPGSGATTKGYVLLRATDPNTPSLGNGNGAAPVAGANTTIVNAAIAEGATSQVSSGLAATTTYHYLLVPFTWDGTNAATYNYLTSGTPATATAATVTCNVWTGADDNVYTNGNNWSCGSAPAPGANVTIGVSGSNNYPTINSGTRSYGNLTIASGASLTVNGTGRIQIAGTLTADAGALTATAGEVELNGTTQNLDGSKLSGNTVKTLVISSNVTLTDTVKITDNVSFGAVSGKVLTSNGFLIIRSELAGTGRVGQVINGNDISGNVQVERYIPQNTYRAWRMLSPNTQGQVIKDAWMEGQTGFGENAGYGTWITSMDAGTWAANGFDANTPGNSLLVFSNSTGTNDLGSWNGFTGDLTAKFIDEEQGYMIFVRGDRSVGVGGSAQQEAPGSDTRLRSTGLLFLGDLPEVSVNPGGVNTLIGNKYASAIDFTSILARVNSGGGNIKDQFTVWDPKISGGSPGLGAYVTFQGPTYEPTPDAGESYGSGSNTRIESGQAFLVQDDEAEDGALVILSETDKISGSANVFRPANVVPSVMFKTNLFMMKSSGRALADGNKVQFGDAYSDAIDNNDAIKMSNFGINFGIERDAKTLIIESRQPVTAEDVLPFKMWNMVKQANYEMELTAMGLAETGVTAILEDKYTGTSKQLDMVNKNIYAFTVNTESGSYASDRFRVVFRPSTTVPVRFTTLNAFQKNTDIQVDWKIATEANISRYEVEHSLNGRNFTKAGTVAATNAESYSWLDAQPVAGTHYYRIKGISTSGEAVYTSIVKVLIGKGKSGIAVYPNPVRDGLVTLQFTNQAAGKYGIRLISDAGQLVYSRSTMIQGTSNSQILNLPKSIVKGIYKMEIVAPDNKTTVQKLIID